MSEGFFIGVYPWQKTPSSMTNVVSSVGRRSHRGGFWLEQDYLPGDNRQLIFHAVCHGVFWPGRASNAETVEKAAPCSVMSSKHIAERDTGWRLAVGCKWWRGDAFVFASGEPRSNASQCGLSFFFLSHGGHCVPRETHTH